MFNLIYSVHKRLSHLANFETEKSPRTRLLLSVTRKCFALQLGSMVFLALALFGKEGARTSRRQTEGGSDTDGQTWRDKIKKEEWTDDQPITTLVE